MFRLLLLTVVLSATAAAQAPDIRFAGSEPPDSAAVMTALAYAQAAMFDSVDERAGRLAPMQAEGYFYHGYDGSPIGADGLRERQNRNNLRIDTSESYDVAFYQYENTAIATYKTHQTGEDRGEPFDLYGSGLIVLTRTPEGWRVASDIIGQNPAPPALEEATGNE